MAGWELERLAALRVMVVGVGALGNEVVKNLALLGVRTLVLVDFDVVEAGNLSRAVLLRPADVGRLKVEAVAERVRELNPDVRVHTISGDIMCDVGLGLIQSMDLVFGAVDNRLARLWLNRWTFRVGKGWIGGGILHHSGQVTAYAPGIACYECGLDERAWRDIRFRMGCADMAQRYLAQGHAPTTPLSASVIGAWMVQEGLREVMEGQEAGLSGKMWSFEGRQRLATEYELRAPREICDSHYIYKGIRSTDASAGEEIGHFLDRMAEELGEEVWIELDHPVATALVGQESGHREERVLARPHLSEAVMEAFRQVPGEAVGIPKENLVSRVDQKFVARALPLRNLGIPEWHILRLRGSERTYWLELAGDRAHWT